MSKTYGFVSISVSVMLILLALNLGVSYAVWFISPPKYTYREYNFLVEQATIFAQPTMDLLAGGKVTHAFHFKNINYSQIDTNVQPLQIRSSGDQVRSFDGSFGAFFKNIYADLGGANQAAIIEPANFSGKWSLIFCDNENQNCQESMLLHSGKVKILVDGQQKVWGKTEDNKYIQLNLVKYLSRNSESGVLFV
ncbi:MAG: hypothetical protein WCK98_07625 [bacterium]